MASKWQNFLNMFRKEQKQKTVAVSAVEEPEKQMTWSDLIDSSIKLVSNSKKIEFFDCQCGDGVMVSGSGTRLFEIETYDSPLHGVTFLLRVDLLEYSVGQKDTEYKSDFEKLKELYGLCTKARQKIQEEWRRADAVTTAVETQKSLNAGVRLMQKYM